MHLPRITLLAFGLAILTSCFEAGKIEKVPRKKIGGVDASNADEVSGEANLTVRFDASVFAEYGIAGEAITYRLKFLKADKTGPVTVNGAAGELSAQGLPHEVSGELVVEFLVSSAVKLAGKVPGLTLKSGANEVTLTEIGTDGVLLNAGWDGKTFQGSKNWQIKGL